MTNQEAKEVEKLKYAISSIKTNMSYPNGRLCSAGEIAIEAIEKQIPKNVEIADDYEELLCPCCGIDLMGSLSEPDHDPYYCFECGQALNWEAK